MLSLLLGLLFGYLVYLWIINTFFYDPSIHRVINLELESLLNDMDNYLDKTID